MSRRIGEDFKRLNTFLELYNLNSYVSDQSQINIYKAMHKKLYGLLIFSAEFEKQRVHEHSVPFITEMVSDLMLALFCTAQGMYKPAKLQLRCSMENFLKSLIMIDRPLIIEEKSVYEIFNAAKQDRHFTSSVGNKKITQIEDDYSNLCRTVHGDPAVMHPISALALLPQYEESLLKELSSLYVRTIENYLGVFYLNYPIVVDTMHPENKKDFLDCLSKSTKKEIVRTLFG